MTRRTFCLLFLMCISLIIPSLTYGAEVRLRDGSLIQDVEFVPSTVVIRTDYGKREIPVQEVEAIEFAQSADRQDTIFMKNGTVLKNVQYMPTNVHLNSKSLGILEIHQDRIERLTLLKDFTHIARKPTIKIPEGFTAIVTDNKGVSTALKKWDSNYSNSNCMAIQRGNSQLMLEINKIRNLENIFDGKGAYQKTIITLKSGTILDDCYFSNSGQEIYGPGEFGVFKIHTRQLHKIINLD